MWAKIPAATASIACAACIAAASVAIPAVKSSESLAKTIAAEVNLSAINFENLDWLSAIPAYQSLLGGDLDALGDLDSLNGIPGYLALLGGDFSQLSSVDGVTAWEDFFNGGGLHSFTTIEDDPTTPNVDETQAGYAALNGTEAWQNFLESGGTDFSADGLGGIDAFSAIPAYATLLDSEASQEDKDKALESLDLVSAIPSIRDGDLSGLDSLNAIPAYQTAFDSSKSPGTRADALRSLDLISAIPEYLGLPTAKEEAEEEADAAPLAAKVAAPETTATEDEPQTTTPLKQLSQTITQSLPQANIEAPAAPEVKTPELPKLSAPTISKKETVTEEKEASKGGGSYSGSFKPEPIVLFGSGKGNGADNGIRGWGEGLKKLGIGGGDTESAGGESGGEGAE
ncbi:hypothetical protein [Mycolicibacterium mageritense]|uniref:PE-PPE domain-containing protein n=1 Tax=Mycolicibacterium mageritense TaxID=53462 RepID=A0AAI8XLI1_MYCME|nr:hypothetical protein [Mycolicibacterium mageritense]BDY26713.1 hypothetical protein hbim_00628 [Mycolicibacterium mageritense]